MNLKIFLLACLCYLIWGCQSVYWNLFSDFSSPFVLVLRITMSFLVTFVFLCLTGRGGDIVAMLRDKSKMKYILPAAALIGMDWWLFIWSVGHGHVLDCNIGYYLNPLVLFLFGLLLFHEKANKFELSAVAIAFTGVVVFVVMTGSLPALSIVAGTIFPLYALCKKFANVDPIVSIAVETMLLSPFVIVYMLIFQRGEGGLASMTWPYIPLAVGCGVITALPMIIYTLIVNRLPMKVVGILQYMGTSIGMVCGVVFLNEVMTAPKWAIFTFIIAGVIVFTVGNLKKQSRDEEAEEEQLQAVNL